MKVLAIEDDADDRCLLSQAFSKFAPGQIVHFAASDAEAAAYLEAHPADLILMDIQLRGINGFQLLDWLQARGLVMGAPVIFLTGSDSMVDVERASASGAVAFQTKPLGLAGMRMAIEQILGCYTEYIAKHPVAKLAADARPAP